MQHPSHQQPLPLPLEGIRVLDLSRLLPGPLCSLQLADLGAEVIKIEDPQYGDYARDLSRNALGWSPFYVALNRNKSSLALDLKHSEGRDLFYRLCARSDVVLESFRPGVCERLQIAYQQVKQYNDKLVYCSLSGYGQTGPYRARAGHDVNFCATVGVTQLIVDQQQQPVLPNIQSADVAGGALAAGLGILAALLSAQRHKIGRYVDVAMTDCSALNTVTALTLGDNGNGSSLLSGALPGYHIYRCTDGYFAVGALEQKFWERLCNALNCPELHSCNIPGPAGEQAQQRLTKIFSRHSRDYWETRLSAIDCCAGPVLSLTEAMQNEQLQAREVFVTNEHPAAGPVTQVAFPIKLSDYQFAIRKPAPAYGEDTARVLLELGLNRCEISTLQSRGIVR